MAIQPFLGLLPERGIGADRCCGSNFASCRSLVKEGTSTGKGVKPIAERLNPDGRERVSAFFGEGFSPGPISPEYAGIECN